MCICDSFNFVLIIVDDIVLARFSNWASYGGWVIPQITRIRKFLRSNLLFEYLQIGKCVSPSFYERLRLTHLPTLHHVPNKLSNHPVQLREKLSKTNSWDPLTSSRKTSEITTNNVIRILPNNMLRKIS